MMFQYVDASFLALWVGCAVCAACVASDRGRGPIRWFLLSLVISAVVTIPLLLALPRWWVIPKSYWIDVHKMNAGKKKKRWFFFLTKRAK